MLFLPLASYSATRVKDSSAEVEVELRTELRSSDPPVCVSTDCGSGAEHNESVSSRDAPVCVDCVVGCVAAGAQD